MSDTGLAPRTRPPLSSPRAKRRLGERAMGALLAFCAGISALVAVGIVLVLLSEAIGFFTQVSVVEFFTETRWTPLFREKHFGILPLLTGSVLVAFGAALVALPGGLLTAIFLSEYAAPRVRNVLRPFLDGMAGVPTVVYGFFAVTFVTPSLQAVIPGLGPFSALAAALTLAIMVLPTVAALSEDALRSVPGSLREAAVGLGATPGEVTTRLVIPMAAPGIALSFIVGVARAFGETMVVAMAAGSAPRLTLNPLDSVQTLSAYILQSAQGNVVPGSLDYRTLFVVGLVLFLVALAMNLAGQWILHRYREAVS